MARGTKRNVEKISESGKGKDTSSSSSSAPASAKKAATATNASTPSTTQKTSLDEQLKKLRDEAEAQRLNVLKNYLKENEGKTIKVTQPPPKRGPVLSLNGKSPANTPKKTPKEKKGKAVKEKVVKEKAVKEKAVKDKTVKEKAGKEKVVKDKVIKAIASPDVIPGILNSDTSSSSSSLTVNTSTILSRFPKKLVTLDENQLVLYLQNEIGINALTAANLKKEKVNGKYICGLWSNRNDLCSKDRIASIFQRLFPIDREYALLINLLFSKNLRV